MEQQQLRRDVELLELLSWAWAPAGIPAMHPGSGGVTSTVPAGSTAMPEACLVPLLVSHRTSDAPWTTPEGTGMDRRTHSRLGTHRKPSTVYWCWWARPSQGYIQLYCSSVRGWWQHAAVGLGPAPGVQCGAGPPQQPQPHWDQGGCSQSPSTGYRQGRGVAPEPGLCCQ